MNDATLVRLYREYSQDMWAAGWMGQPEEEEHLADGFTAWLRNRNKEVQEKLDFVFYEESALPTLRKCWQDSQGG